MQSADVCSYPQGMHCLKAVAQLDLSHFLSLQHEE